MFYKPLSYMATMHPSGLVAQHLVNSLLYFIASENPLRGMVPVFCKSFVCVNSCWIIKPDVTITSLKITSLNIFEWSPSNYTTQYKVKNYKFVHATLIT